MGAVAALAIVAAPAAAAAPPPAAPGGRLDTAPVLLSPGPPNGALAEGLAGWQVDGREPPELLFPGARIGGNVTLVAPPFTVPAGAQSLAVRLRARGGGGLMVVSARPLDGGPDVELATLEPDAAARTWAVGVAAVAGRAVRIVLDPVPALGTSVEVQSVGPVTAPLPGWTVAAGALDRRGSVRRGVLAVREAPLRITSPGFRPGSGARELVVAVRGDGVLRGVAGRRAAAVRATPAWRDLRVPVRGGTRRRPSEPHCHARPGWPGDPRRRARAPSGRRARAALDRRGRAAGDPRHPRGGERRAGGRGPRPLGPSPGSRPRRRAGTGAAAGAPFGGAGGAGRRGRPHPHRHQGQPLISRA